MRNHAFVGVALSFGGAPALRAKTGENVAGLSKGDRGSRDGSTQVSPGFRGASALYDFGYAALKQPAAATRASTSPSISDCWKLVGSGHQTSAGFNLSNY